MRKLTNADLNKIWSRIKVVHKEREAIRSLDRQMVDYDYGRNGFLVRRKDRTFTTA